MRPHAQSTVLLRPGPPTERSLSAGAVHVYELRLAAGDFVHIVIRKHAVDLSATLVDPDGHDVASCHDDLSEFGDEIVVSIAAVTGHYELRVRSILSAGPSSRYAIEVVALRPASPQDRVRMEAEATFQRARSMQDTQQPRAFASAHDGFAAALNIFRRLGDQRRELRALIGMGEMEAALGNPAAFDTARQAEQLATDLGDEPARATAFRTTGRVLERRGDLLEALGAYEASTAIWGQLGDRKARSVSLNSEGIIYGRMGDSERAIARFQESLVLARASSNRVDALYPLNNLGIAYKDVGKFDKSLDTYKEALAEQRRSNNIEGQAVVLNNMGNVLRLLGRHKRRSRYIWKP